MKLGPETRRPRRGPLAVARRALLLSICFWTVTCPGWPQSGLTVEQLEHSLVLAGRRKVPDAEMAKWLGSIQLDEQLGNPALKRFLAEVKLGPQSLDAMALLAAASTIQETPEREWLDAAPPAPDAQHKMIDAIVTYSQDTLTHMPDFIALRLTRTFDNSPVVEGRKHSKPVVRLHFAQETRRELTYRNGRESPATIPSSTGNAGPKEGTDAFQSWGEFGPILRTLLSDSFQGSVEWSHWERGPAGQSIAVFSYSVPQPASHYLVDYCCYQTSEHSGWSPFKKRPAYRGRIYFDPSSKTLMAIGLSAEFEPDSPMIESGLAVQYGSVDIGGRSYICPASSVVVSVIHSFALQALDGTGLEKHINLVRFSDYHKFGSVSRILPSD